MRLSGDCLTIFRERVLEDALIEAGNLDEIDRDVLSVLDKAVAAARAAPVPDVGELTADVYVRYA
jgi:pyruvate dehydrogenase E1 component alpha subunit